MEEINEKIGEIDIELGTIYDKYMSEKKKLMDIKKKLENQAYELKDKLNGCGFPNEFTEPEKAILTKLFTSDDDYNNVNNNKKNVINNVQRLKNEYKCELIQCNNVWQEANHATYEYVFKCNNGSIFTNNSKRRNFIYK